MKFTTISIMLDLIDAVENVQPSFWTWDDCNRLQFVVDKMRDNLLLLDKSMNDVEMMKNVKLKKLSEDDAMDTS